MRVAIIIASFLNPKNKPIEPVDKGGIIFPDKSILESSIVARVIPESSFSNITIGLLFPLSFNWFIFISVSDISTPFLIILSEVLIVKPLNVIVYLELLSLIAFAISYDF